MSGLPRYGAGPDMTDARRERGRLVGLCQNVCPLFAPRPLVILFEGLTAQLAVSPLICPNPATVRQIILPAEWRGDYEHSDSIGKALETAFYYYLAGRPCDHLRGRGLS